MTLRLTVAVIAGGQSARMGTDKAFLRLKPDGPTLIETILAGVRGLGAETILITNRPADYAHLGVPMFGDVLPGKGALGGLYTAVHSATQPHILALACDMPFVVRPFLDYLISRRLEGDAVVPRLNGEAEPFRAVYARTCLGPMRAALEAGKLRVISFFPEVRVRFVEEGDVDRYDPQHLSFFNINTPEDLEAARRQEAA